MVLSRNENQVREKFLPKLARVLASVPFAEDLVAAYYCALDRNTPMKAKGILFGALAYFILPLDAVPDLLPGIGYVDDLGALGAALLTVASYVDEDVKRRARERMREWFGTLPPPGD